MKFSLAAPPSIETTIILPSSKSLSNRALVMSKLAGGLENLQNLSDCDDTLVMTKALAEVAEVTDIHAAGTAMRFSTAYFSCLPDSKTVLTGTARMKQRPISILVDALRTLGANIEYVEKEGFPPLRIIGKKLDGGKVQLPGNVSSQYISALMMIAPYMEKGLELEITGSITSQAYLHITTEMMRQFGAEVTTQWDKQTISIQPGQFKNIPYAIENDWSGSSYWYEILALNSDMQSTIQLPGLFHNSLQGDSKVKELFLPLGVKTDFTREGVLLTKIPHISKKYVANLINQPDLAQTLVVACAMKGIPFEISGLHTLRIKETDRLTALRVELAKLGICITEKNGDTLIWNGERTQANETPTIDTYEDHRMAMSFAPCCIFYPNLQINNPHVVSKSYPHFWDDLRKANFKIYEE